MEKNIPELPKLAFIEGTATAKMGPETLDTFLKQEKRKVLAIQKRDGYAKVFLAVLTDEQ